MYQTFWMLTSIVGGGIYFDEFSLFGPMNFAVFPIGVFVTLTGIYILTYSQGMAEAESDNTEKEDEEDEAKTPLHSPVHADGAASHEPF